MWTDDYVVNIQSFSHSHIDAWIIDNEGRNWRLTGFYGQPDASKRHESWSLLRHLHRTSILPWMVMGDLNEIVANSESTSQWDRQPHFMQAFRDALDDCNLCDIGFTGPKFTWCNRRRGREKVRKRLDRVLCTEEWKALFPEVQVHHLVTASSDHMALSVRTSMLRTNTHKYRRPIRFEEYWTKFPECAQIIEEAWHTPIEGTPMFRLSEKIKGCRKMLANWSRTMVRATPELIRDKQNHLQDLELDESNFLEEDVDQTRKELAELMEQEEIYWKQRSRISWLHKGDLNTKYFHSCASQRQNRNTIFQLKDENNQWVSDINGMGELASRYFQNLFSTSNPTGIAKVTDGIDHIITPDMNSQLLSDFSEEEIKAVLFQMHPTKAPGPDGMSALFFQKYWHIVGNDVLTAVLDCLRSGHILKSLNSTNIALIPKVGKAESLSQFRPISLCNVVYKIISKVLANRMKSILSVVISDYQSAFVPGRLITDNILIAFEVMHYLNTKRQGKTAHMAAKLDMSKAYDRVEWNYLQAVMLKMGFERRWVNLIMECLSTVSYSVLINGEPHGYIRPSRGLRQGDPLSPYLFLICAEGLSALFRAAERERRLCGVSICRGGPRLSHLLFADDSLIFCRALQSDSMALKEILHNYEMASGQQLNFEKSALFFSKNTPQQIKEDISTILGTSLTSNFGKYLGLPPLIGRKKRQAFEEIKTRIWKRLQGWKGKLLSQAGREVLIKAVAYAIPTYAMSCFKIPETLCSEIQALTSRFWWGQRGDERKIHWLKWEKLSRHKQSGGMGFRDLSLFNQAMLAKQGWRLLTNTHSLIHRVLKAKYFPQSSFMDAGIPRHSSYTWRSIANSRHVLEDGLRWRIGDGSMVKIWQDKWLPIPTTYKVVSPCSILPHDARVEALIHPHCPSWNHQLIDEIFLPHEADTIKALPLKHSLPRDSWCWVGTSRGEFTVQSAYHMLKEKEWAKDGSSSSNPARSQQIWKLIWKLGVQPKIKNFLWRACSNILPTRTKLFDKKILSTYSCTFCQEEAETVIHILWSCPHAREAWQLSGLPWSTLPHNPSSITDLLEDAAKLFTREEITLFSIILWKIWGLRNALNFGTQHLSIPAMVQEAAQYAAFAASGSEEEPIYSNPAPQRWKPPAYGRSKINFAIIPCKQTSSIGFGLIIRDWEGFVLATMEDRLNFHSHPTFNQARGLLKVLNFCLDTGFWQIEIDCEDHTLVSLLHERPHIRAEIGLLVDEIVELIRNFQFVFCNHVPKGCNLLARALASDALAKAGPSICFEDYPPCLQSLVISDLHHQ